MHDAENSNSGYLATQQVFLSLSYLSCHNFKRAVEYFSLWLSKLADFHTHTPLQKSVCVKYGILMGRRHGQVKSLYWIVCVEVFIRSNIVIKSEKADGFVFSAGWLITFFSLSVVIFTYKWWSGAAWQIVLALFSSPSLNINFLISSNCS